MRRKCPNTNYILILKKYFFYNLIRMPRRRKSKAEQKCECYCFIYTVLFMAILYLLNSFIISLYGMGIFLPAPHHDNPHACKEQGYQLCTTKRGKCTHRKEKCVYPEKSGECTYVKHIEATKKKVRKSIEKAYKNETTQLEQIKIRQEYCASEKIQLYDKIMLDLSLFIFCAALYYRHSFSIFFILNKGIRGKATL